jgi:hypothetical protein
MQRRYLRTNPHTEDQRRVMRYDRRRWRTILRPPKDIYRPRANVASWPTTATLEYRLGQCLDDGILRIALLNIRIADIKVRRSPTEKRAEIEATITIINPLSLLKHYFIIILYSNPIIQISNNTSYFTNRRHLFT